jgi:hypothetical protein
VRWINSKPQFSFAVRRFLQWVQLKHERSPKRPADVHSAHAL